MPAPEPARPLSPAKRALGILGMVAVVLAAIATGMWVSGGLPKTAPEVEENTGYQFLLGVILAVLGCLTLAAGAVIYAIVHFSNGLTSDFSRPFFSSLKTKLYLANLFVILLIAVGVAQLVTAVVMPILQRLGVSSTMSFFLPMFGTFIVIQFVLMMWLQIWAPLEKRVIDRRMAAMGVTPEQIQAAMYVGISDPTKSSFRKMTTVEDDIGMMWFFPEALMYRGDAQQFDIPREKFIAMERKADAGSTAAYFGAVNVIVRFLDGGGKERSVRFHTEADPTLGRKAKALNTLAARIQSWLDQAPAAGIPEDEAIVEPLDDEV